jgi:carbon monoxide dehydrogenase subunit G
MIVSGRAVVPLAVPELWAALSDPARLGQALPHVDTVDVRDDGSFSAIARPRTGLGDTPLRMEFEIADRREGEHVRIVGAGLAGENTVSLNIELDLSSSNGGSSSEANWTADVRVGGVLASLVQRSLPALFTAQVNEVLAAAQGGAS